VFVHELGHFLAAKKAGVFVETFSLGMGPKLLKKTVGDTEYCLSAIPLGGYVKLKGENPDEAGTGAPDELMAKSLFQRFYIFLAGPAMNGILAVGLMSLVFYIGIQMPKYLEEPPVIGLIDPDSPAEKIGLQQGDLILSVGGQTVSNWEQAYLYIASAGQKPLDLIIERNGRAQTVAVTPEEIKAIGASDIGIRPIFKAIIGGIQPGFPADKAGMQAGDEIIAINGTRITHWVEMAEYIHAHPEEPLAIKLVRAGQELDLTVTPKREGEIGYLGITSEQPAVLKKYGLVESFQRGTARCWEMTTMTFELLRRLVTRQASTKTLGGPIMIAQMSGQMIRLGLSRFLEFMAMVSLSLAIFNLLPIPILDGGHIFLLLVEFLYRKPLSPERRELVQKIGLLILVPLFLFVFYNDIARLVGW